jgi:small subunit ribosomal protein S8
MLSDVIADMLTRIRNAQKVSLVSTTVPNSHFRESVLKVLKEEGYIEKFQVLDIGNRKSEIEISLKYLKSRKSCIQEITRISKPGRRIYVSIKQLSPYKSGMGIHILSTSKGVLSDRVAHKMGVGGELLCRVF